jgi:hypothetical protein
VAVDRTIRPIALAVKVAAARAAKCSAVVLVVPALRIPEAVVVADMAVIQALADPVSLLSVIPHKENI